jgi:putative restriction endonuclease
VKAIFDTRAESGYDDEIIERYHFPNRYLPVAQQSVGDWIIYREPRRGGGRSGYVAVARLLSIDPDPVDPGRSYARMADFLPFDAVVPLEHADGFYEARLQNISDRSRIGVTLQGRSVRPISDEEFGAIARAGLATTLAPENAARLDLDAAHVDTNTLGLLRAPPGEQERRIAQMLVNRKIRDASFRRQVCDAYENICAVTGLRIVNGSGKAEVQAAHIWPVAEGGPDVVQNGIALSGTVHWLFDRHLISLTDDYGLLVSHNRVPRELQHLFQRHLDRIHLPKQQSSWPHLRYIQRHRDAYFAA